jgi:hypothetical protein
MSTHTSIGFAETRQAEGIPSACEVQCWVEEQTPLPACPTSSGGAHLSASNAYGVLEPVKLVHYFNYKTIIITIHRLYEDKYKPGIKV